MANPLDAKFWTDEAARTADELIPVILRLYVSGAQEGEDLLPANLRALLDWDKFNRRAVDWLDQYKLDWIFNINETTRRDTIKAIQRWMDSGEKLDVLKAKLAPLYGEARAGRIAVTEVTRVYAEGNEAAWKATDLVQGRRWNTGNDELVCPICAPLNGVVSPFGYPFVHPETRETYNNPPAHVNCRCFETPVLESDEDFARMLTGELG